MEKETVKVVYKIELLILFVIAILYFIKTQTTKIICAICGLSIVYFVIMLNYEKKKDNKFQRDSAFRIVVSVLLFYFIVISMLGLILGFTRTLFSPQISYWTQGFIQALIVTVLMEYIRYTLIRNNFTNKISICIITLLMIFLNIIINSNIYNLTENYRIFVFICTIVFPAIAQELLGSYMVYNYGLLPAITYKLVINLYIYVLPIFTHLGDYLYGTFEILIPFTIYMILSKYLKNNIDIKQRRKRTNKISLEIITIPILICLIILIVLISGIFKYQIIAIASDSMIPTYERGDVIIFEKIKQEELNSIEVGDILVFKKDDIIITHRVVKIKEENSKIYFYTKGDNNLTNDVDPVKGEEVIGVGKKLIKYIGFPTVTLNEILRR